MGSRTRYTTMTESLREHRRHSRVWSWMGETSECDLSFRMTAFHSTHPGGPILREEEESRSVEDNWGRRVVPCS